MEMNIIMNLFNTYIRTADERMNTVSEWPLELHKPVWQRSWVCIPFKPKLFQVFFLQLPVLKLCTYMYLQWSNSFIFSSTVLINIILMFHFMLSSNYNHGLNSREKLDFLLPLYASQLENVVPLNFLPTPTP